MARSNEMFFVIVILISFVVNQFEASSLNRLFLTENDDMVKRDTDAQIIQRILSVGKLTFNSTVVPKATERRKIPCLFVFDKEASFLLNNNLDIARIYATQLATLTSLYTAHANIVVTNAGTEIWANVDKIPFTNQLGSSATMEDVVAQFQGYLDSAQKGLFGTTYAVGVLLSNKTYVYGGLSQAPPCTTAGVSLLNYRPVPWSIAGLLAHELAHTLSVIHPFQLSYICQDFPKLSFCSSSGLPAECTCDSDLYPPKQCLMTFQFGAGAPNAARFTSCDIEMMNYFSSGIPCLIK